MSGHTQRTTIRLPESLLAQAKEEARRRGETLTELIADGLRLALKQAQEPRRRVELPVSKAKGWVHASVDLNSNAALLDLMEQETADHERP
jgi:hypothetical protein